VSAQTTPAPTCECWCGVDGRGAESKGTTFTNQSDCRAKCEEVKEKYIACSFKGDKTSPHTNLRCWTAQECVAPNSKGEVTGRAELKTPAECLPRFTHCYPLDKPISLSVSLGGITQVQGIGGYISAVYQWLLGAVAVFAVIIIMVGGIQYMLAGGSSSGVTEAKKRIFGALIGIFILLGAYLILNTVNPQLLSLKLPALPKVRSIQMPGGGQTCENYFERGYKITVEDFEIKDLVGRSCGEEGIMIEGPDGDPLSGDDACMFTTCVNPTGQVIAQCMLNGQGTPVCQSCTDIRTGASDDANNQPSEGVCGAFRYTATGGVNTECYFFPPSTDQTLASMALPDPISNFATEQSEAFCGKVTIDCGQITMCNQYGFSSITRGTNDGNMIDGNLTMRGIRGYLGPEESVCTQDLCGIGPCVFNPAAQISLGQSRCYSAF